MSFYQKAKARLEKVEKYWVPLAIGSRHLLNLLHDGIWTGSPHSPLRWSALKQSSHLQPSWGATMTQNYCLLASCQGREFAQDKQSGDVSHWDGHGAAHLNTFKWSKVNSIKGSRQKWRTKESLWVSDWKSPIILSRTSMELLLCRQDDLSICTL